MVTIQTVATVTEDGTLTAEAATTLPRGRHRVVLLVLEEGSPSPEPSSGFPDLSAFRKRLGVPTHPGNTILEMREEEGA